VSTDSTDPSKPDKGSPIRVAPKPKVRKQLNNVFLDDRGYPDQSGEYDHVLHNIDGGPILHKLRHPQPNLNAPVDPLNYPPFISAKHEAIMRKDMDLSHLDPALQEKIYNIICCHWSVFDEKGIFVPVKHYKCVINTGNTWPISVKKILYGERKIVIMHQAIAALYKVGHIR
jgi:hypothetical protein